MTMAKYTDEDRATAFRIWIEQARSYKRVSEIMEIPAPTIQSWAMAHDWEERRVAEASSFLPGASVETAVALRLGGLAAAQSLQQIAYDDLQGVEKANINRVRALSIIISHAGFGASPADRAALEPRLQAEVQSDGNAQSRLAASLARLLDVVPIEDQLDLR